VIAFAAACCIIGGTVQMNTMNIMDSALEASAARIIDETYENLTYRKYRDFVTIVGCDESAESVEIPAEIDGVPVTTIGEGAFKDCTGLISVTIPDSVTNIKKSAFSGCSGLTSIIIPDSVTNFGEWAVSGTPWLEEKQKENPLVVVNDILIDGVTCDGDVVVPDGVTSIGNNAFIHCKGFESITIPSSVISIGDSAFYMCSGLKSITILNPFCKIYDNAHTICSGTDMVFENADVMPEALSRESTNFNGYYGYYFNGVIRGYSGSTAETYAEKYGYDFESIGEIETILGDANCDGEVSIADATLVLQYCGDKDKYVLTEHGIINADVDGTAGISAMDALKIQEYDAGIIDKF
ncbi:MAG: leucine-rich repeat protein, partial [Ruminococcus sp.]|nr:leucine-rich repeat protein [Ruminococcus sp.]